MAVPVDVIGEPGQPPRQGWRDHVDLRRGVDDGAHRGRQLVHPGNSRIGDEQEAVDRRMRIGCLGVMHDGFLSVPVMFWYRSSVAPGACLTGCPMAPCS